MIEIETLQSLIAGQLDSMKSEFKEFRRLLEFSRPDYSDIEVDNWLAEYERLCAKYEVQNE